TLTYVEWCSQVEPCELVECDHTYGRVGCQLDNRQKWAEANPAMGRRISEEFIAGERRSLPPAEFARERLGWWEDPVGDGGFTLEQWLARANPDAQLADPVVLALDL